jgi:hypothetical protein
MNYCLCIFLLCLCCFSWEGLGFSSYPFRSAKILHGLKSSGTNHLAKKKKEEVFGAEMKLKNKATNNLSRKINRSQIMQGYERMRSQYLADSALIAVIGFSFVWFFGSLQDSLSYGLGSVLGLCYSVLLGKYVERLGTNRENKAVDNIRFAPVIILVILYAKYKTLFAIIPELIGFVLSYQVAGFLQMFNEDPYGEMIEEEKTN